jgi:hypothetical protein
MSDVEPRPDDELVSAYLDGEATPDERAVVEARPDLLAKLNQFRSVAGQVADVEPPDPARRAAAVDAALQSSDQSRTTGSDDGVVDLGARRTRARRPGLLIGLSAAAAVVLVVAIGAAVLRSRSQPALTSVGTAAEVAGPTSSTAVPDNARAQTASPAAGAASGAAGNGAQADSAAGVPVVDFGNFADQAALDTRLRAQLDLPVPAGAGAVPAPEAASVPTTGISTPFAASGGFRACDGAIRAGDPALVALTSTGTATVSGQPVYVGIYSVRQTPGAGTPPVQAVVVTPACTVVSTQPS